MSHKDVKRHWDIRHVKPNAFYFAVLDTINNTEAALYTLYCVQQVI